MFNRHLIIKDDDGEKLFLFIDFDYEFSSDFNMKSKKEQVKTLYGKVLKYINDNKIKFEKGAVILVASGIVIGSLLVNNYQYSDLKGSLEPKYQYSEQVDIFDTSFKKDKALVQSKVDDTNKMEVNTEPSKTPTTTTSNVDQINIQKPTTPNTTVTATPSSIAPTLSTPAKNQTTANTSSSTNKTSSVSAPTTSKTTTQTQTAPTQAAPTQQTTTTQQPAPAPAPTQQPVTPPAPAEQMVTIYRSNGTVEQLSLESYIVGVVAAEMPASFNAEALKAQSIIARTYALKKISHNQVLTDTTSTQVYNDINQMKTMWGSSFQTFYNKITNAVTSTKGQYLAYNGTYIEAVYHSTSNGKTEDAVAVWGNSYPYLKTVDSHWDLTASSYLRQTDEDYNILSKVIGIDFNPQTSVQIIARDNSDRVSEVQVDGKTYTGVEFRNLLGLRSADFDISIQDNKAVITTRGYGHGVGMSQYGANGMANEGYNYKDILLHYYTGVQLKS